MYHRISKRKPGAGTAGTGSGWARNRRPCPAARAPKNRRDKMNRPYVFCHMLTSLDGKIMGSYMETPEGEQAGEVFYDIAFGKNPY